MKLLLLPLALVFACDPGPAPGPVPDPDPIECDPSESLGGQVTGTVCGEFDVDTLTIAAGETLTLVEGTTLNMAAAGNINVQGTLVIAGTSADPVSIVGASWRGISVSNGGVVDASHAFIQGNGAAIGSSGELSFVDSTLDLNSGPDGPDCTSINGGTVLFDHVQFTNCHCPLHINAANTATVTNSIFDGASVPVMLSNTQATFRGNHFAGTSTLMLDIGGNIFADVGGNYWDGGNPDIGTNNPSQFLGADDFSTAPFEGVGPR